MKIDARSIDRVLQNPGPIRAVLLYGEDNGLIRSRAATLVRAVLGAPDDPFRLAELDRETHRRLGAEMTAGALTGGRRAIRVRDATDTLTATVEAALNGKGEALLILEAGALLAKSKLRTLCEQRADAAAIACPREEARGLEQLIRRLLEEKQVTIDPPTLTYLASQLGADHGVTEQEIEKLALYVGTGGTVDLTAAMACIGDSAGLQVEDALFAAFSGDVPGADRALETALAEGATAVGVLRMALGHLHRLQRVRAAVEHDGTPVSEAVRSARPPVFGRRAPAFTTAAQNWRSTTLAGAATFVSEAERDCKRTGTPPELLCRHVLLTLARRARPRPTK